MNDNEEYELEDESEAIGLPGFEAKYKNQMRQILTQKIDLPISTLPAMLADQIQINPNFQRRDRWDEERQSRLIESLLMNVPIPPVFLGEDEYGHYVVLDGRQRLTAIQNFLNNTLELQGLKVWDDLNGARFIDLVKRGLDKHLTRRFISAIALLKESSPIVKYDVFDRLNTGGVKANEMEVRNAVFRGGFTDLLHELSRSAGFCALWDIPRDDIEAQSNQLYQKMTDLSIVLRFFSLFQPDEMDLPFKDHLGAYMEEKNAMYSENLNRKNEDSILFKQAVDNTLKVFGSNAFRNIKKKGNARSLPISDAVMIALASYKPNQLTPAAIEKIKSEYENLFEKPEFIKAISSGTNGKGAIKNRINLAREAFSRAL